jgi:transcriptional regulator with XRE-family HTH domain
MKQAALARLIGVGRSTLHGWENGRSEPPPSIVARIAAIFGMTEAQFYGDGPYPEPPAETQAQPEVPDDPDDEVDDEPEAAAV